MKAASLRRILSFRSDNAADDEVLDLREELKRGLIGVVRQIDEGYARSMTMYTVAFYVGILMVLSSVVTSVTMGADTAALVLGGLGMADVLAMLVFQPTEALQSSRGNLAQLQAAFFNWTNDIHNWNRYLELIDIEATSQDRVPPFERVGDVSARLMGNTEDTMKLIQKYCEVRPPRTAKR